MSVSIYGKYVIDQVILLMEQNNYAPFPLALDRSFLIVPVGLFVLAFSYVSMKQMSYFARLAMMMTIFEMIYLNLEIFTRFYAIMTENKRLNDLLNSEISKTKTGYSRVN